MAASVLVTDYSWPTLDVERTLLAEAGGQLVVATTGSEEELVELAPSVDAILTCWKPVTGRVLRAASNCLTVARYGVGLDNIDVSTATELGMVVTNVPDFCTDEVADHTLALLLALARHVVPYANQTAGGGWDNAAFGPMRRLRGQTLGLVGHGSIARSVASRASAFGLSIVAYSRSTVGRPPSATTTFADDLDQVLAAADVLSLHVPSTPATRHILDRHTLARVKPGAVILNTSRGDLIDEEALLEALADGRVAAAGLDVLAVESAGSNPSLARHPRVLITPHAAFSSRESLAALQRTAAGNVATVLRGERPTTIVNPEVLDSPRLRSAGRLR